MKPKKHHWCHNCKFEGKLDKAEIKLHQLGQCDEFYFGCKNQEQRKRKAKTQIMLKRTEGIGNVVGGITITQLYEILKKNQKEKERREDEKRIGDINV